MTEDILFQTYPCAIDHCRYQMPSKSKSKKILFIVGTL